MNARMGEWRVSRGRRATPRARCAAARSTSRCAPLARPGRRPARRLRRHPRGALRRDPPTRLTRPSSSTGLQRRMTDGAGPAWTPPWWTAPPAGCDHHPARGAVDQRPEAGGAARAGEPGRAQGRGDPPLGHPRPAGRAQGRRVPHRVHHRVHLGRRPGRCIDRDDPAPPAAAVPVRAGHEHGHQGDRGHRRARRDRGRAAARAPPLHHPRQPAPGDHASWSTPPSRPGTRHWWGAGHRVRVGLEEVRVLGVEPDDRVARTATAGPA